MHLLVAATQGSTQQVAVCQADMCSARVGRKLITWQCTSIVLWVSRVGTSGTSKGLPELSSGRRLKF